MRGLNKTSYAAPSVEFRPLNTTDIIKIRVIRAIRAKKWNVFS